MALPLRIADNVAVAGCPGLAKACKVVRRKKPNPPLSMYFYTKYSFLTKIMIVILYTKTHKLNYFKIRFGFSCYYAVYIGILMLNVW